ncbi:MAG TPA: DUF4824 family protein [Gemmatimonadales bacterium]|nr:DUF4824 family protein [Gemmatimonadales bacterium]
MTGRPGWLAAILIVVATNLVPLGLWYWNSRGEPVATVDLTEREAWVVRGGEADRSVRLSLQHRHWDGHEPGATWADSARLVAAGFRPRQFSGEEEFLTLRRHPLRRPLWVLLRMEEEPGALAADSDRFLPRLVPVAVGTDPEALYRESGDRSRHLVMRGVVGVYATARLPGDTLTTWSASLRGVTPNTLHVPRSLVPVLERLAPADRPGELPRYQVRITMGRLHLPKVTGVFPANQQ